MSPPDPYKQPPKNPQTPCSSKTGSKNATRSQSTSALGGSTAEDEDGGDDDDDEDKKLLMVSGTLPKRRSLDVDFVNWKQQQQPVKPIYANGNTVSIDVGTEPDLPRSCSENGEHRICLEEVAPSSGSIVEGEKDWKLSLDLFSSKKRGKQEQDKSLPSSIRRYYKKQDELITAYEEMQLNIDDVMQNVEDEVHLRHMAHVLARASFFVNLLLLISKAVAAGLSGSLSIISSVIDSAVDLVSGALMWWSNKAMRNRDPYIYPQGRTKLEPVAIVVLSVIMALASMQVIRDSVQRIIFYVTESSEGPDVGVVTITICIATLVLKLILFLVSRRYKKSPSVQALAMDHRNDLLSNSIALACGIIGDRVWRFVDPIGAIVISLYIIVSWSVTGWDQIKMLTGHTAQPDFMKKLTWISLNHHQKVIVIDTVRAFHFGQDFLVEVDIVLPEEMTLRESHDIGESLQLKLERLPEVERAFVHIDYEYEHNPRSEHKQV